MNIEHALIKALGSKELELIKANEAIRLLQEEVSNLKESKENAEEQ